MWPKALLTGFIVYVVYRIFSRIVMPIRKMKKEFDEQMKNAQRSQDSRNEGEVRVENIQKQKKKGSKKVEEADYVDFEEVD